MPDPTPLTEAEALARAVEALRAANLPEVASGLMADARNLDLAALNKNLSDLLGWDMPEAAKHAVATLYLTRAGYQVTPPAVQRAEQPDPPGGG
jgi:hypothetical protein